MPRWTDEARQAQAERMRQQKLWLFASGPKTEAGKKRSSLNALKHGMESEAVLKLKQIMKLQKKFLKELK